MRKQNAAFLARYISRPGTQLYNNDFYASAEGDQFACYVVVDGLLEGEKEDESAKIAAEAVIEAFHARPSMRKLDLSGYLKKANAALLQNRERKELTASITVVVTDYQKLRYAHLGNTRFTLLRKGKAVYRSKDHSLSQKLADGGKIPLDAVEKHEERNNLTEYLGQDWLEIEISRKIKLVEGDIVSLSTRGFWEHCDQNDMLAAIAQAADDPEQALENVERLLLDESPTPDEIDNYTVGFLYINKVFHDPNKGKRIKAILKIVIPVFIILLIAGILLFFYIRGRNEKREAMELAYTNAIGYIQDENYTRAKTELETAFELAEKLRDKERKLEIDAFRKLVEAVLYADERMEAGDYEQAQAAYLRAQSRSRYTDQVAAAYLARKLEQSGNYLSVLDYITLGDTLTEQGNYTLAEERYLQARRLASQIYYADGKQAAMDALTALYEKMQTQVDEDKEQASAQVAAADYIVQGDKAAKEGDFTAAKLYYTLAKEQYSQLDNPTVLASIEEKLAALEKKDYENEKQLLIAATYVEQGDLFMSGKKYAEAKREYMLARNIYATLGEQKKLDEVQGKIELADLEREEESKK